MDEVVTVTASLASVVVILTALWAAVRSGLRVRDSMRDNSVAVRENTRVLNDLVGQGGRIDSLEAHAHTTDERLARLEAVRRPARALFRDCLNIHVVAADAGDQPQALLVTPLCGIGAEASRPDSEVFSLDQFPGSSV